MSLNYSTVKTPRGAEVVRVFASGQVSVADAQALTREMSPGGKYARHAVLGLVERGAEFSAEARQALTVDAGTGAQFKATAIVVTAAPMRVMLSFIVRITGSAASTRFFPAESVALEWLNDAVAPPALEA